MKPAMCLKKASVPKYGLRRNPHFQDPSTYDVKKNKFINLNIFPGGF